MHQFASVPFHLRSYCFPVIRSSCWRSERRRSLLVHKPIVPYLTKTFTVNVMLLGQSFHHIGYEKVQEVNVAAPSLAHCGGVVVIANTQPCNISGQYSLMFCFGEFFAECEEFNQKVVDIHLAGTCQSEPEILPVFLLLTCGVVVSVPTLAASAGLLGVAAVA